MANSLAVMMAKEVTELDVNDVVGDLMSQAPAVRKLFYSMNNTRTIELLQRLPRTEFHESDDRIFLGILINQM